MISHDAIWQAIDRLAEHAHLSTSGLARKAGLDPTAFNRSKRISPEGKPRWPSTESVSKILSVTGVSVVDFMTFIETRDIYILQQRESRPMPHLPMFTALKGDFFDSEGRPLKNGWDAINIAQILPLDMHDYTLEVEGTTLEPLYRDGSVLILSPTADIRKGDRVLLKLRDGNVIVAEFQRRSAHKLELKTLRNPGAQELSLANEDISWIARILWASQ